MKKLLVSRPSPWLFPATYVLHASEEYGLGETFPVWISRVAGVHFTANHFLWLNGIAMVAMLVAAALAARSARCNLLLVVLATVVVANGAAHTIGSVATASYSPGLLTGVLLWIPLGVVTLCWAWFGLPRGVFVLGVLGGTAAHAVVSAVVLLC